MVEFTGTSGDMNPTRWIFWRKKASIGLLLRNLGTGRPVWVLLKNRCFCFVQNQRGDNQYAPHLEKFLGKCPPLPAHAAHDILFNFIAKFHCPKGGTIYHWKCNHVFAISQSQCGLGRWLCCINSSYLMEEARHKANTEKYNLGKDNSKHVLNIKECTMLEILYNILFSIDWKVCNLCTRSV